MLLSVSVAIKPFKAQNAIIQNVFLETGPESNKGPLPDIIQINHNIHKD